MKRLKRRLRRKHRSLRRTQAARKRVAGLVKWFRKRDFEALRNWADKRRDTLVERAKELNREIRKIEREIEKREERASGSAEKFVKWVRGEVGTTEGSARHREYIEIVGKGGSMSWPWCSIFTAAGLVSAGGFDRSQMPSNPWYSGAWLTWAHGHRVSYSQAKPGDLLIYDWGDGGMTDHVEVFVGSGQGIGGNESHSSGGAVNGPSPVSVGSIVGVVRPNWT